MDTICPASTIHAAFNALRASDKTLVNYDFNDHEGGGVHQQQAQLNWLAERFDRTVTRSSPRPSSRDRTSWFDRLTARSFRRT